MNLAGLQRAGVAAVIAVAYAASVTWLGYILSTMLMTAAMAYYLGLRNPLAFIPGVIIIPIVDPLRVRAAAADLAAAQLDREHRR